MEKQVACAAAMSSSGEVVPPASSARAFQLTSKLARPEVSSDVRPLPENRSPFQVVLPLLTIGVGIVSSFGRPDPPGTGGPILPCPATRRATARGPGCPG